MTKLEVQQRVLKNGKPLGLKLFSWDKKTSTFSTDEYGLVLDFRGINNCTFKTGSDCTFSTRSGCTFDTGSGCTFNTSSNCTFNTGSGGTFKTGSGCTFKTDYNCTFDTGSYCTFDTNSYCTFKAGSDCTFETGSDCVIVRRDEFQVIQPLEGEIIQLCPYSIKGFLANGYLNRDASLGKHIIVDNILSKVLSQKGNVYKVINHGQKESSFIIQQDGIYSHGKTLEEAKKSLIYKISSRDTSIYKDLKINTMLTKDEAIKMYRVVTGACESGTRYFVEQQNTVKDNYTIKEIIELTKGQYGNETLVKFLKDNA